MTQKVLHVCPYLHPAAGGPAVVVLQYARRLAQFGFAPFILTTDWYSPGGKKEVEQRYAAEYDVRVLETGDRLVKMFSHENRRQVRQAVAGADVLHVHGLWHPLGLLAMREARALGKPYVVSPHGMLDPYSMSVGALKKRLYWKLIERRNVLESARVLFTTEDERNLACQSVGQLGCGEIILLGADDPPPEGRQSLKENALLRYPFLAGKKVVLYLGRLHEKKGLHTFVAPFGEVLKAVPEALLLVVGDGETGYKDLVRDEIRRCELEHAVYFTGLLEGRDKWSAVAASDVFVLPSMQENFALVVAEVMKMGVPVLVSDKVNLASYVQSADAGRVLSLDNRNAWAQTVIDLLRNDGQRTALSDNAVAVANSLFSWDTSTAHLAKVYKDVLRVAGD